MRRTVSILFFILLWVGCYAQQHTNRAPRARITGTLKADYKGNEKGTPITFIRVSSDMRFLAVINGQTVFIPVKKAPRLFGLTPKNAEEFWFDQYLRHQMWAHYKRKGYRHVLRGETMNEAGEYLGSLNGLFYGGELTRSYMESLFADVAPRNLDRKRPEQLRLEILKSPNPDAYMLGNGTLLITTGLLSTVDSADELAAVMAGEIAHYVLDHQVVNIGKERGRVRKARVWGAVLAAVATAAETLLSQNNERYIPGGILLTATVAGEIMNAAAISKLGMGYSNKQYFEADDIALQFLKMKGINTAALSSALQKIKAYYLAESDSYALSREGGYGNVDQRMARLEAPRETADPAYLRQMSEVASFNAMMQFNSNNFRAAERLIEKKINNGCATDDDYLVLVQSNMGYTNSPEGNERNLELVRRIKTLSETPNLGLYKQEILLLFRLDRRAQAIDAINEYIAMVTEFKQQATNDDDVDWANSELAWSNEIYRQTVSGKLN